MLFVLILLSNILITGSFYPLIYIAAAILHEMGHLFAICSFGYQVAEIKFMGFGIRIKNKSIYSYSKEIVIAAMGPLTNIIFAVFGLLVFEVYSKEWIIHFVIACATYALVNLLPVRPLDGYTIFSDILYRLLPYRHAKDVLRITGMLFLFIFLLLLFYVFIKRYLNISLILIFTALLSGAFIQLKNG